MKFAQKARLECVPSMHVEGTCSSHALHTKNGGHISGMRLHYFSKTQVEPVCLPPKLAPRLKVHAEPPSCNYFPHGLICKLRFANGPVNIETPSILWDNLCALANNVNVPWLMIGDFNEVVSNDEKRGGRRVNRYRARLY